MKLQNNWHLIIPSLLKVFNYEGQFLRQIGGEGVTNYPIGVGINHLGEIVVVCFCSTNNQSNPE